MLGVDQFNSVDQMNKCYEKAQKHVSLSKIMLPAAIAVTILSFVTLSLESSSFSTLSTIMDYVWLIGIVAFYSVNGTWKYIGKLMAKPWHWHFGFLFILVKVVVCAAAISVVGVVAIILPIVPYLYGIYLDKKTMSSAETIAAQLQYQYAYAQNNMNPAPNYNPYAGQDNNQYADPNYNQYANQYYGQYQPADNAQYI